MQVQKSIGYKKEGGDVAVPVKSNREWNASVTEGKEWLTARKASDTELTVSATSSPEKGVREGNITIANNALTAKLRVVQTGGDLIIEVAEESRVIQVAGTGNDHLEVNLLSNTDYEVVIPEEAKDWITEKDTTPTISRGRIYRSLMTVSSAEPVIIPHGVNLQNSPLLLNINSIRISLR